MSTISDFIRNAIISEERSIVADLSHHARRLALLEICRAVDSLFFGAQSDPKIIELYEEGANKALLLFMDESCSVPRTPMWPSNDNTFRWAHATIQRCGRLAICERFLEYERTGMGRFVDDGDHVWFETIPKYSGVEAVEAASQQMIDEFVSEIQRPIKSVLDAIEPRVHRQMQQLVYVWSDHFIGYDGTPQIDAYFDQRGILAAQSMLGHDVFTDDADFGGLPFGFYRASIWTLIGWALKHIQFASLLHERHPNLHLQNLLTVTGDVEQLRCELSGALQVSAKDAAQALDLLELNRQNAERVCINGHAVPPLIRAASQQFIRPLAGFLMEPFQFMLRNMRIQFQSDWDRAVNDREQLFRSELFELFPQPWLVKIPTGIAIRRQSAKITDIDAIILDLRNGIAALFQLKWQDPFGHSMRERASRMKNFQREANSWVNSVSDFLQKSTNSEITQMLGCTKSDKNIDCRLFVVGRYFAHFSGDTPPDDRAAWGLWPQVVGITKSHQNSENPLSDLYSAMVAGSPYKKRISWSPQSVKIGGKEIRVRRID